MLFEYIKQPRIIFTKNENLLTTIIPIIIKNMQKKSDCVYLHLINKINYLSRTMNDTEQKQLICCRCGDDISSFEEADDDLSLCDWCHHIFLEAKEIYTKSTFYVNHMKQP